MKHRETFMKKYLHPMIHEGLLSLTIPDKPRSPKQKYVITPAGMKELGAKTKKIDCFDATFMPGVEFKT